jgi:hypothetical protein
MNNGGEGGKMIREEHPVWIVYDKLRSACLNVKYYSYRLQSLERQSFWLDIILAGTAPTSAIAGLWFWENEYGKIIWQWLGVIAAVAALLKPVLGLTKRIKDVEPVLSGYRTLEYDLREIKSNVEQKRRYDTTMQTELKKALQREKVLVGKTPETRENQRVKRKCQAEVKQELPREIFYVPEE